MILSHSRKFIFIRPPKTGSTSVQQALVEHCRDGDWISTVWMTPDAVRKQFSRAAIYGPIPYTGPVMRPPELSEEYEQYSISPRRRRLWAHTHAVPSQIRRANTRAWSRYLKITIVRNPWAQVHSVMRFSALHGEGAGRTFENAVAVLGARHYWQHADVVLRFEHLAQDVEALAGRLGLNIELSHFREHGRSDYREHLTPDQQQVVAEVFSDRIERFGYEFGA